MNSLGSWLISRPQWWCWAKSGGRPRYDACPWLLTRSARANLGPGPGDNADAQAACKIFFYPCGFLYQDYEEDEEDDDEDEDDTGMGDEGEDSNEGTGSADGNDGYEADEAEVTDPARPSSPGVRGGPVRSPELVQL